MGSLLGMNRHDQEKEEESKKDTPEVLPHAENNSIPAEIIKRRKRKWQ